MIEDDDYEDDVNGEVPSEPIIGRDPFEIIGDIPSDRVYQWVTLTVYGSDASVWPSLSQFLKNGWNVVPPERHPDMPSGDGKIIFGGQVLVEASKEHAAAARRAEEEKALAFAQLGGEAPLNAGSPTKAVAPAFVGDGGSWQQLKDANDQHLKSRPDPRYAAIDLTIGLVLTEGEIDAAAFLGLDVREYARRKFLMNADLLQRLDAPAHRSSTKEPPIFAFVRLTTTGD